MDIYQEVEQLLKERGFEVATKDLNRPWGGFFAIKESQAPRFIELYYPNENIEEATKGEKLSPKILIVQPHKRLSWQYHHRRAEVWKLIKGQAGIVRSKTDEQGEMEPLKVGVKVNLAQGERHRLVGLDEYGIIAEIWRHTDPDNPSDENDIVRLEDDFNRL